jgi:hypothetical protein
MDSTSIGSDLFMSEGAEFAEVILRAAKIGGQLDMTRAKVTGTLNMDAASIGSDLFMSEGQFTQPIEIFFAKIGGNMDLRGATLARARPDRGAGRRRVASDFALMATDLGR